MILSQLHPNLHSGLYQGLILFLNPYSPTIPMSLPQGSRSTSLAARSCSLTCDPASPDDRLFEALLDRMTTISDSDILYAMSTVQDLRIDEDINTCFTCVFGIVTACLML